VSYSHVNVGWEHGDEQEGQSGSCARRSGRTSSPTPPKISAAPLAQRKQSRPGKDRRNDPQYGAGRRKWQEPAYNEDACEKYKTYRESNTTSIACHRGNWFGLGWFFAFLIHREARNRPLCPRFSRTSFRWLSHIGRFSGELFGPSLPTLIRAGCSGLPGRKLRP